ncbi:hypothetical protein AYO38_00785 [bacterium SCGC AG-212-C10]|nr:hypothetical protein AYO38_00785 [bacterium SCGC AG-212-C10]
MSDSDTLRELALALPHTSERSSYGTPRFRVKDKLFARLKEDGVTAAIRMNMDQREVFCAAEPEKYHYTPHYAGSPMVLVTLAAVSREEMENLLLEAWLFVAPKRVRDEFAATLAANATTQE